MTDYIDREALKEYLYGGKFQEGCTGCDEPGEGCIECIVDEIDNFPAANVAPVRLGQWERYRDIVQCSNCGFGMFPIPYVFDKGDCVGTNVIPEYCPKCGKEMREVPNDN